MADRIRDRFRSASPSIRREPVDKIVAIPATVGLEMEYNSFPIVHCDLDGLEDGAFLRIARDGQIRQTSNGGQ